MALPCCFFASFAAVLLSKLDNNDSPTFPCLFVCFHDQIQGCGRVGKDSKLWWPKFFSSLSPTRFNEIKQCIASISPFIQCSTS